MSGSPPNPVPPVDPSMEDILASIRRILSDDEAAKPDEPAPEDDGVLQLEESMMVSAPVPPAPEPPMAVVPPVPVITDAVIAEPMVAVPEAAPEPPMAAPTGSLLAPEAAQAATDSVGTLLRSLIRRGEQVGVYRGGPTIEDMVREEIRPLLKAWLDANLPAMVERQVRVEIERVVGRAIP